MAEDESVIAGLSIRLVPDGKRTGAWSVAFRNDGRTTLSEVTFVVAKGGIPCPLDLGSTIVQCRQLDTFHPSDELRVGSFKFVEGGEYLDRPLSATLCAPGRALFQLNVNTEDFGHLAELRGEPATGPIPFLRGRR